MRHLTWLLIALWAAAAAAQPVDELPARATLAMRLAARALVETPRGEPSPATGSALLDAFDATGDPLFRDGAARVAAELATRQLESGGWTVSGEPRYLASLARQGVPQGGRVNTSQLAGGVTTDALRLLLRVNGLTAVAGVPQALQRGLHLLLDSQLAGGGWPAVYPHSPGEPAAAALAPRATPEVVLLLLDAGAAGVAGASAAAAEGVDFLLSAQAPDGAWGGDAATTLEVSLALLRAGRTFAQAPVQPAAERALDWLSAQPAAEAAVTLRAALRDPRRGPRSREERERLTAARAPVVADLLATQAATGWWPVDEPDPALTASNLAYLAQFVREYEPLREPVEERRPPQHRR